MNAFQENRFMPFEDYIRIGMKERAIKAIRAHNATADAEMKRRKTDAQDLPFRDTEPMFHADADFPACAATEVAPEVIEPERMVSGAEADDMRARCGYTIARTAFLDALQAGYFPPGSCSRCGR